MTAVELEEVTYQAGVLVGMALDGGLSEWFEDFPSGCMAGVEAEIDLALSFLVVSPRTDPTL